MKCKRRMCSWLIIVSMLFLMTTAWLDVTQVDAATRGAEGLFRIPAAEIMADGRVAAGYHVVGTRHYASITAGVAAGVEASVMTALMHRRVPVGHLKVRLLGETQQIPAVAVGLVLQEGAASYYGAASKQLGMADIRAHIAFGTGPYKRGVFGVSRVVSPVGMRTGQGLFDPLTTVAAEYDGAGVNVGFLLDFGGGMEGNVFVSTSAGAGGGLQYTLAF